MRERMRVRPQKMLIALATSSPDYELQPSFPNVGRGVRDNIGAQISAPSRENSVQRSQYADHDHCLPSLIAVRHAEYQGLRDHRDCDASADRGALAYTSLCGVPYIYRIYI